MNIHFSNLWNQLKTNFWLIPVIMTTTAFFLSYWTLNLDQSIEFKNFYFFSIWKGGSEGARGLLSAIAGSIITITGVVFSITTVSLALASNQYGSKLLPNFIRDIGNQIVLGTFISTSIYTLLVLRTVRGQGVDDDFNTFVPNLSITISIGLAIISLIMLIYFIHHLSVKIQSTDIISRVAGDLIHLIETSMPNNSIKNESNFFNETINCQEAITSSKIGYLQVIDYEKLYHLAKKNHLLLEIDVRSGCFLKNGHVLAKANKILTPKLKKSISKAFVIGRGRSPIQDIEYAVDQLVTIALRSLSSNANDTFTTNTCIDYLGAALCLICDKQLTPPFYFKNSYTKLLSNQETFEGLIDACFNQIRQYSTTHPSVLIRLLETLSSILLYTQTLEQRMALNKHAQMIKNLDKYQIEEQDRKDIQSRYRLFQVEFERLVTI